MQRFSRLSYSDNLSSVYFMSIPQFNIYEILYFVRISCICRYSIELITTTEWPLPVLKPSYCLWYVSQECQWFSIPWFYSECYLRSPGCNFHVSFKHARFLRRGRQPEENISRARTVVSPRDNSYKNLGDTTVLAREMFSSGCRPRLENARA